MTVAPPYRATPWSVDIPECERGRVAIRKLDVSSADAAFSSMRTPSRAVAAGTYTALYRDGRLWMSDTPAEQRDHYQPVAQMRRRGGRVLIMGLGLGMVVKQALALPNVDHVDVVEVDPDVVHLVGPTYAGARCTIHEADAFTIKWPPGTRWTVAWHDVWQDMSEDNLPEMARLARSYGRRCDWQGFWGKETILHHRRRTADAWWRGR